MSALRFEVGQSGVHEGMHPNWRSLRSRPRSNGASQRVRGMRPHWKNIFDVIGAEAEPATCIG